MNFSATQPPPDPPGASCPARILVVDDQPANIQVLGTILGRLGHEIIPARSGASALERLALRLPDLILLDLLMPEMDGCEVCRRLRENSEWENIPVIFLSAADDKDFIVRAFAAGGVDYITKPFNPAELISRVQTQLTLKSTRDQLKQLAEDKDELLGILAHDLKNHLGGMAMSARLLRNCVERGNDVRATRLAENIFHSSNQLLAFVKEFLTNAAADHGIQVQPMTLNLSDAATAAVRQYQEAARRKELKFQTDLASENNAVWADPSALRQVLENLISNAVKFSPPGRQIQVRVRPGHTHIECLIQDHGPGFTVADREKMFRRYGRLSARPTAGEPSSGLGLSIVRKLVSAMNGELHCESAPCCGAAFTVRLPLPPPT